MSWLMERCAFVVIACLFSSHLAAEPMHFEENSTGGNCLGCEWIQATGEITDGTTNAFERFLKTLDWVPHFIRLNSPGGSLSGGITLGEKFRELGVSTEVGASESDRQPDGFHTYSRVPGICASACAYAFLGGEQRLLDTNAKLGFHRFYTKDALASSTSKLFSGQDLDNTQRIAAALSLYIVNMGVDARLLALASQAGPDEIRWLTLQEARDLRVTYEPYSFKPWRLEPYENGAIAVSESNDGLRSVVAGCSARSGPYVALIDASPDVDVAWLEQCRALGDLVTHTHPVFGTMVPPSQTTLSCRNGRVIMRFQLPTRNPPLTSPNLLSWDLNYAHACSTDRYYASTEDFGAAVRLAFRNCHN